MGPRTTKKKRKKQVVREVVYVYTRRRVNIPRRFSWLSYLSNRELAVFRKRHGYKKSTVMRKSGISERMDERARLYALERYAKENIDEVTRRTGISKSRIRKGRLDSETITFIESRFEIPDSRIKGISRLNFDFDSGDYDGSILYIVDASWPYVKGKRFWFSFRLPIDIGTEDEEQWHKTWSRTEVYEASSKKEYRALIIDSLYDKMSELSESYNIRTKGIEYTVLDETYPYPDVDRFSVHIIRK